MFLNLTNKARDYRNIVILQGVLILAALLLKDIVELTGLSNIQAGILRDTIFLPIVSIYLLVIWHLLSGFTSRKYFFLVIILLLLLLMAITVNPYYDFFPTMNSKRPCLFIIHFCVFLLEMVVIIHAIFDIFSDNYLSQEKIWGSASIFLMIGIAFGSLYDVLHIITPGCIGLQSNLGLESYTDCISYSMAIIGGQDSFSNATSLIVKLGIIEAVISNLFVVLLVGQLLSKPGKE